MTNCPQIQMQYTESKFGENILKPYCLLAQIANRCAVIRKKEQN